MTNRENLIKKIKNDYAHSHLIAIDNARIEKEKYYKLYPELLALDDEISSVTLEFSKNLVESKSLDSENIASHDKDKLMKKFRKDHKKAVENKRNFLIKNNIPLDYKKPKYKCPDCEDTGYQSDGSMCHCYKQKLTNLLYDMSNINKNMLSENFDNFNINLFSNEIDENYGLSPRDNMKRIFNSVKAICDGIIDSNGIIFSGSTGLGKTYLCNCIAKDMMEKNKIVLYQTSINLVERMRNYKMSVDKDIERSKANYFQIYDADVLIIDDFGTELNNSFVNSEFFSIINDRLISKKMTIISTNLSDKQIQNTYSDRVSSRLIYNYDHFMFFGEDLRTKMGH